MSSVASQDHSDRADSLTTVKKISAGVKRLEGLVSQVLQFSREIKASPQRADEDADQAYHRQFLAALEQVVAARGLVVPEAMAERKRAWRKAYLNTPHGQPVDLAAADAHGDHDDDHHHHGLAPQRAPVAVSPAVSPRAG